MPSTNLAITHVTTGQDDKIPTINDAIDSLDEKITENITAVIVNDDDRVLSIAEAAKNTRVSVTGSDMTGAIDVTVPDAVKGFYFVTDNTSSGTRQAITFTTVTGTGVVLPRNTEIILYNDGTDIIEIGITTPIPVRSSITDDGAEDIDFTGDLIRTLVMTQNMTLTFSNVETGSMVIFEVSGNFTLAFPSSVEPLSGGVYDGAKTNIITVMSTNGATTQVATFGSYTP